MLLFSQISGEKFTTLASAEITCMLKKPLV